MMAKYYRSLEEQQSESFPRTQPAGRLEDRERKNYERKLLDLNKTNRQLSADV